jgi:hypothetical protein
MEIKKHTAWNVIKAKYPDSFVVIAEALSRISQEFDKIGGYERLESLQSEYLRNMELVEQTLPSVDIEKESLNARFRKLSENTNAVLKSRNPAILKRAAEQLDDLYWNILSNTHSHLVSRFYILKSYKPDMYKNYNSRRKAFSQKPKNQLKTAATLI